MISSSLAKPSVKPTTMFDTRVRDRPWSERFSRSSSGRSTSRVAVPPSPASLRTVMAPGMVRLRVPLGPFTVTSAPLMVTSTPEGTEMGALPMRDMRGSLPDVAEDFAADLALARLTVGHQPIAGGQDGHPEATEDTRDAVTLAVDPQAGGGDAPQAGDGAGPVGGVLHRDRQHVAGARGGRGDGEAGDVALLLQDRGERDLLLGGRHAHLVVHRRVGVADAGEHVGDGIGQHRFLLTSSPWSARGSRPRGPSPAGTRGTARTCGRPHATGRSDGSGCTRAPCTSAWRSTC